MNAYNGERKLNLTRTKEGATVGLEAVLEIISLCNTHTHVSRKEQNVLKQS